MDFKLLGIFLGNTCSYYCRISYYLYLIFKIIFHYFRAEWEYLVDRFTLEDPKFCRTMFKICSQFDTEEKLNEVSLLLPGF